MPNNIYFAFIFFSVRSVCILSALAAGLFIIPGAQAQQKNNPGREDTVFNSTRELAEVTITGAERTILVKESPQSIVLISSARIDRSTEPNIIDALVKNVPGLNAVKTGPNISKPFIRGLGYNRVLTLYDGIRQEGQQWGDEHGIEVDGYNMNHAEVIKGPASLMYGSDAVAGVVSLFPYVPKEKDGLIHGRILEEFQTNNGLTGTGLRLGSSHERWFWIARGSYRMAKNYTNNIDGRVYNTGFREINAGFSTGYTSSELTSSLHATWYDNLQGIPDGSRDSLTRRFTKQAQEGIMDTVTGRPLATADDLNGYTLSPLHQHIQHYRVYSKNHYRIGNGSLDAILGFQQNARREYNHPTQPRQAGMFVRLNTMNYGVKYLLPEFSGVELSFGVNGMLQFNKNKDATDFPIPDYFLHDIGGYAHAKWKVNKLMISGGIRYDQRVITVHDFYTGTNPSTGFGKQMHPPDTTGAYLQFPALHKRFTGISASFGATYQLTEKITLKANLARGYRSPSITELASNGLDPGAHIRYLGNSAFLPEFSFQQDIGISGIFKEVSASLSLFNNSIQHYIYLSQLTDGNGMPVTDAQGNKTFQYRQSAARLYGAEASLDIRPESWKGFEFSNSFALTYGINKNPEYAGKGINGEYLSLIPPPQLLSAIRQEIYTDAKLFSSFSAGVELQYSAAQNRFMNVYNTESATPSSAIVNVSATTHLKIKQTDLMQLQLQVNNIFDIAYQNNLSRLKYFEYYSASPNARSGIYNMGRNICAKMIVTF